MRKYGQHFLVNERIIEAIVSAVPSEQNIVEIGPGRGALTQKLVEKNNLSLTAVEIDPQMKAYLLAHFPALRGRVLLADFLDFDMALLPRESVFFVSNLPYIDAAAILDKVLSWPYFSGAVFMFQKEQAQRILASAGAEGYGPLSILTQLRARPQLLLRVGKACFNPPPKVESAVLTFKKQKNPLSPLSYSHFVHFVKAAFAHKRKTLYNSLILSGFDKKKTEDVLARALLKPTARAQEITLEQYLQLHALFMR